LGIKIRRTVGTGRACSNEGSEKNKYNYSKKSSPRTVHKIYAKTELIYYKGGSKKELL